jgi:hypothetical protein
MKTLLRAMAVLTLLSPNLTIAADMPATKADDAYVATKSAQIETLRVRLGGNPSANATVALLDVEDLLRRYRAAPAAPLRSQLDAAVTRLELELMATGR